MPSILQAGVSGRACARPQGAPAIARATADRTFTSSRTVSRTEAVVRGSVVARAVQADVAQAAPTPPPEREVEVAVKTVQLDGNTRILQCYCKSHLRFEPEYGRKRGTTTNCYLIQDGGETVLIDIPRQEYSDVFVEALKQVGNPVQSIVLTHMTPQIAKTLGGILGALRGASQESVTLVMSKPALTVLQNTLGTDEDGKTLLEGVQIEVPGSENDLSIGRRALRIVYVTTPRYPDMLCVYERTTRRLFSSCLFSAHVNPQQGKVGTDGTDLGGWDAYGPDWQFFFDCMFAPTAKQTAKALEKLDISVATGSASSSSKPLLMQLASMLVGKKQVDEKTSTGAHPVAMLLPRHGPVVKQSVTRLITSYTQWVEQQVANADTANIAVLYASAYGNTATLAQGISRGITKAGVGAEMVNLEQVSLQEAEDVLARCQGFVIGSPTLGGHLPTQVSAALGAILRSSAAKALPCGVYGSFGWSGEAVDILNSRLTDAGFDSAFKPIKVKFQPDAKALQVCEESGTDLAQKVLKGSRKRSKETASRSGQSAVSLASEAQQAMGRVVGSLSIVTAKDGDAESAMLASWLSQASFDPPGLTVAVKKDRAVESLLVTGNTFNVNILADGQERDIIKALLKPFTPGEDRFEGLDVTRSELTGCAVLKEAVSVLECRVTDRMDAGDHWIVYGCIEEGTLMDASAVSAVHHRKSGVSY